MSDTPRTSPSDRIIISKASESLLLDPVTGQNLSSINCPKRPRKLGDVKYVQFGKDEKGLYLPKDIVPRLKEFSSARQPNIENLYAVVDTLAENIFFSPGSHYSCSFITGDVGEIRKIKIEDKIREVLVVPQGKMRAEANSSNFEPCGMVHPLSRPDQMLTVMALTMMRSGIKTPYFRGFGYADIGNDMAMGEEEFSDTFVAATWDFFGSPAYKMPASQKKLVAVPQAWHGDSMSLQKVTSTYQPRVKDRRNVLKTGRAQNSEHTRKQNADVAYFTRNGMLADAMCYNMALCTLQDDQIKLLFPEGSENNYFFVGKTQKTVYDCITKLGPKGIGAVTVHTPEEIAQETGYRNQRQLKGRELMYDILRTKIDGVLILGTFRGIEYCQSFLPEEGEPILFPWKTRTEAEKVRETYYKTVYGINGGTELTSDLHYCCMFDTADLQQGIVQPLNLHHVNLEDII